MEFLCSLKFKNILFSNVFMNFDYIDSIKVKLMMYSVVDICNL